jgi:F0F1-type ATP synthase membrane subunit c/vacuolar-type H+-ATPase subunit K
MKSVITKQAGFAVAASLCEALAQGVAFSHAAHRAAATED